MPPTAEAAANPGDLRFTRSRQAGVMLAAALASLAVSAGIFILSRQRIHDAPGWGWGLAPLPFAALFLWLAWNHTRHAYLILSRLGIEIYPFLLPARNMHLVLWQEISAAEVTNDLKLLVITLSTHSDAKIFVSLSPIARRSLPLLQKALRGVMNSRGNGLTPSEDAFKSAPPGEA